MKVVVCIFAVVAVAMAQRSPYAPRPVGYPEVLNRFNTDSNGDLPTRIDGDKKDQGPLQTPEGSIGDPYLVNRVNEWPRDKQPFWYLNREHILDHRGQRNPNTSTQGTQMGQVGQTGQGGQRGQTGQGQGNRQGQVNRQGGQLGQGNRQGQGQGQGNRQGQSLGTQQGQWNRQQ